MLCRWSPNLYRIRADIISFYGPFPKILPAAPPKKLVRGHGELPWPLTSILFYTALCWYDGLSQTERTSGQPMCLDHNVIHYRIKWFGGELFWDMISYRIICYVARSVLHCSAERWSEQGWYCYVTNCYVVLPSEHVLKAHFEMMLTVLIGKL